MIREVLMSIPPPTRFRLMASANLLIFLSGGLAPSLAQDLPREDIPRIEVSYTQILATDSLSIGQAALSPDGRWVVFTHNLDEEENCQLWIVSADGGQPFPIISAPGWHDGPVWFPGSDRIAYRSEDIMSLAIDPSTGRPLGLSQRVTLEGSHAYFDVSPDGRWIAYTPMDEAGNRVIRVVPSNGGIPHTIVDESTSRPVWAPDGKSIYYRTTRIDSPEETLKRISVEEGRRAEGAEPEEVFSSMMLVGTLTLTDTAFLSLEEDRRADPRRVVISELDGRPLGLVELEKGMRPGGISPDGRTMLAVRRESSSPLRIAPVAGGPSRTLQQSDAEPLAWTPAGDQVLLKAALDGEERLFLADVSGGTMRELRLPEEQAAPGTTKADLLPRNRLNPVLSGTGRHLLFSAPGAAPDTATLKILDLETGQATTVTTQYPVPGSFMQGRVSSPGGAANRDGDEFFYWEKDGRALVLKAATATGELRVLRSFNDPEETITVAVRGDWIAYVRHDEGDASILLAEVGDREPRPLLTVYGFLDCLAWSPDGRWLAATHWPRDGSGAKVMLIRVSEEGNVEGEPRYLGPGAASWWGHQWLPDSSGFLTAGTEGRVWFMPVDPAADPVPFTEEGEGEIFNFVLSPDGRQIAYAPWIVKGSSLWLIDLGDALTRTSR
jgi:Tol biopolymer transport system component